MFVSLRPLRGVMPFELVDQPARIIDADVQPAVDGAQERARQFAQFARGRARRPRKLAAARPVDEAVFEVDAHGGVGALEEPLDFAEEGGVQWRRCKAVASR